MKAIKLDFIIHWLWAAVFGILLITGIALMGAKYGWVMNYQIALADYLHRTMAAVWVVLTIIAVVMEAIRHLDGKQAKMPWLIINNTALGRYVLVSTLLFTISGVFLWICKDFSHTVIAFSLVVHDLLAFISVPVIILHIWDKAYALPQETGGEKDV